MIETSHDILVSKGCVRLPSTASLERELEGEVETGNKKYLILIVNVGSDYKNYQTMNGVLRFAQDKLCKQSHIVVMQVDS